MFQKQRKVGEGGSGPSAVSMTIGTNTADAVAKARAVMAGLDQKPSAPQAKPQAKAEAQLSEAEIMRRLNRGGFCSC